MSASIGTPLPPETMERVVEVIEALPHNAKLGIRAAEIARGRCVTYIDYRAELVGDPSRNVLHGGVVTALIDTTAGAAVYSCLSGDTPLATLDMRIDYLKPTESDRRLHANAEVRHLTRRVGFVCAFAYQDDPDNRVAICNAVYMIGSLGLSIRKA